MRIIFNIQNVLIYPVDVYILEYSVNYCQLIDEVYFSTIVFIKLKFHGKGSSRLPSVTGIYYNKNVALVPMCTELNSVSVQIHVHLESRM